MPPLLRLRVSTMRRRLLATALAASGLFGAAAPVAAKSGGDPQVAGEVLVRLRTTGALPPLLTKYSLTLGSQFGARPIYRLKVIGNGSVAQAIAGLQLEPDVLVAEPNTIGSSPEARKNVVWAIGNATDYVNQWAPQAMGLAAAQKLSTGSGIRVAVLDTGIDTHHPVFAGKLIPGFDFVDNDTDPSERGSTADAGFGHGTHVAGLVTLVAPGAKIMPLRVLDPSGKGNIWVLAEAMLHAVDPDHNPATNDGVQVINASLGTTQRTRVIETVMQLATCSLPAATTPANDYTDPGYNGDKDRCKKLGGVVIVAAAGNGGSSSEKQYPAAENEYGLLPVTASASNGRLATFSNNGSWVDVAAPGDHITSTVPGGGYGTWSGTSMAAPLAAGTAALVRWAMPTLKPKDVARRLVDNGASLCGTSLLQVNAQAALAGKPTAPRSCP